LQRRSQLFVPPAEILRRGVQRAGGGATSRAAQLSGQIAQFFGVLLVMRKRVSENGRDFRGVLRAVFVFMAAAAMLVPVFNVRRGFVAAVRMRMFMLVRMGVRMLLPAVDVGMLMLVCVRMRVFLLSAADV
jgi:hypothetical protein